MNSHELEKLPYERLQEDVPPYLERVLLEHDVDAERSFREMGRPREIKFISCKGLVSNKQLMEQMQRMLRCIQDEYEYPVDTEFTVNLSDDGDYSIDLLQCRPLQIQKASSGTVIPEGIPEEKIFLESKGASMGMCKTSELELIVYVDPVRYYEMPYRDKPAVARLIGKLNWHFRDLGKHMMLIVPGRVGTTSPELASSGTSCLSSMKRTAPGSVRLPWLLLQTTPRTE